MTKFSGWIGKMTVAEATEKRLESVTKLSFSSGKWEGSAVGWKQRWLWSNMNRRPQSAYLKWWKWQALCSIYFKPNFKIQWKTKRTHGQAPKPACSGACVGNGKLTHIIETRIQESRLHKSISLSGSNTHSSWLKSLLILYNLIQIPENKDVVFF